MDSLMWGGTAGLGCRGWWEVAEVCGRKTTVSVPLETWALTGAAGQGVGNGEG